LILPDYSPRSDNAALLCCAVFAQLFVVPMASKRRAKLYTLPIVVGIGFLAVAGLATWRRADLIATLSDQIAHGEKSKAPAAVSQLGAISNPPVSILVEAAACDDGPTVEAAQVAINKLLDDWQHQVDNDQRLGRVADQVSQLAAALAEQRRTFPTARYSWLASITHKMVRVADKCPSKNTPLLALHCDEIMTLIGNASYAATTSTSHAPAAATPQQVDPATASSDQAVERNQLEQAFTAFPSGSPEITSTPLRSARPGDNIADEDGRLRTQENPLRHETTHPGQGSSTKAPNAGDDTTCAMNGSADRPDWAMPSYRIPPNSEDSLGMSAAASEPHASSSPLGTYSTRELLERWRTAGGDDHRDIENQLTARGFKHLSPALVQQYLSTDEDRLRIVDTVLKLPGSDVRPWLFLLADDEDADVRLMAVTVMATSDDRALIEKAWQISIRDQDPRIADLSVHLRERRSGTQLR
jgi:hypothetical protein